MKWFPYYLKFWRVLFLFLVFCFVLFWCMFLPIREGEGREKGTGSTPKEYEVSFQAALRCSQMPDTRVMADLPWGHPNGQRRWKWCKLVISSLAKWVKLPHSPCWHKLLLMREFPAGDGSCSFSRCQDKRPDSPGCLMVPPEAFLPSQGQRNEWINKIFICISWTTTMYVWDGHAAYTYKYLHSQHHPSVLKSRLQHVAPLTSTLFSHWLVCSFLATQHFLKIRGVFSS